MVQSPASSLSLLSESLKTEYQPLGRSLEGQTLLKNSNILSSSLAPFTYTMKKKSGVQAGHSIVRPTNDKLCSHTQISISLLAPNTQTWVHCQKSMNTDKNREKNEIQKNQRNLDNRIILKAKTKKRRHLINIFKEEKNALMK